MDGFNLGVAYISNSMFLSQLSRRCNFDLALWQLTVSWLLGVLGLTVTSAFVQSLMCQCVLVCVRDRSELKIEQQHASLGRLWAGLKP